MKPFLIQTISSTSMIVELEVEVKPVVGTIATKTIVEAKVKSTMIQANTVI